jgi:hypothetical protein
MYNNNNNNNNKHITNIKDWNDLSEKAKTHKGL